MKNLLAAIVIITTSFTYLAIGSIASASDTDTSTDSSHTTKEHEEHNHDTMTDTDGELPQVTGEVKKVKPKSGKITIKHDEIPNLDMPGMTMVFRVAEGIDISQFEKGDNVQFTVIENNGKMTIVEIESVE